jgi:hypothetical protein
MRMSGHSHEWSARSVLELDLLFAEVTGDGTGVVLREAVVREWRPGAIRQFPSPFHNFPAQVDCLGNVIGRRKNVEDSRHVFTPSGMALRRRD